MLNRVHPNELEGWWTKLGSQVLDNTSTSLIGHKETDLFSGNEVESAAERRGPLC